MKKGGEGKKSKKDEGGREASLNSCYHLVTRTMHARHATPVRMRVSDVELPEISQSWSEGTAAII